MNIKLLLNLLLLLLSFQTYPQSSKKVVLIKSRTFISFSGKHTEISFSYNQQGQVTSTTTSQYVKNGDGKRDAVSAPITGKYSYHKDSITYKNSLHIEHPDGADETFFLNPQKLAQKQYYSSHYKFITQCRYDKAGYLTYEEVRNLSEPKPASKSLYKYHQGNLVQMTTLYYYDKQKNTPTDTMITKYEYHLDKLNTFGNANYGKRFYGKSSKNLLKSLWKKGKSKTVYLYTFDKKGRAIEMIEKDKPRGITVYQYYD